MKNDTNLHSPALDATAPILFLILIPFTVLQLC